MIRNFSVEAKFGVMIGSICIALSLYAQLGHSATTFALTLLLSSTFFFVAAIVRPSTLSALCSLWMKFGDVLAKITNPLILATFFYLVMAPTKLFGRYVIRARYFHQPASISEDSYWVVIVESRDPETFFKSQF
jgi:hypothetical protein